MNVVMVLMDSLNRHFLGMYGNEIARTPNLDRVAKRSMVFDRHYYGSMPCMPARHDILVGNLEFPWRPWGPIEPHERSVPKIIRENGIMSSMVTDHYHYFEIGGENYHVDFESWQLIRGHENDPWISEPNPDVRHKGRSKERYNRNIRYMKEEKDFPCPRTMSAAADWLSKNADKHDPFFLFIDEFDPHEPFHVPPPYDTMYEQDWDDDMFIWPYYGRSDDISEKDLNHLRAQYAGKITMADKWLGKVLEQMDRFNLWENTLLIITTDHGHFLGDHGWLGKPNCPQYNTISHIPLLISGPGISPGRCDAITCAPDFAPTILAALDCKIPGNLYGKNLLPLAKGEVDKLRDWHLFGKYGNGVGYVDDKHVYLRAPVNAENSPLCLYRSTFNTHPHWTIPYPDERFTWGKFLPGEDAVVGRVELSLEEKRHSSSLVAFDPGEHRLFELADEKQKNNLAGTDAEADYARKMKQALAEIRAPEEQLDRLGLREV